MYTLKIYIFSAQQLRPKKDIDGHAHTRCCNPGTLPLPYASHLPKSSNRTVKRSIKIVDNSQWNSQNS